MSQWHQEEGEQRSVQGAGNSLQIMTDPAPKAQPADQPKSKQNPGPQPEREPQSERGCYTGAKRDSQQESGDTHLGLKGKNLAFYMQKNPSN